MMNITSPRAQIMRFLLMIVFCALNISPAASQERLPSHPAFSHTLNPAPSNANRIAPTSITGTVRVLAVMVEFIADDDARTSGTGKFGTIYPVDYGAEILDPYPHDKAYFQNHLEFLKNYVRKASRGSTTIETFVMDNIVTVPGKIQDYSTVRSETNKSIADFTVAAWTAADAAHPGFDFSGYDMFIIFHAGRGQDVDLTSIQGSNPTPFDLPSLSFTLDAFKRFYDNDYQGIPVSGGSFRIDNTSVIPTTDNREISLITGDRALLELTINGLIAASFGTFAGLPDLFDTKTGKTGIGRFGLMDAESIFAYGGICPPAPSAWERVRLGWAAPAQAEAGSKEYTLTAQSDIVQIPVTGSEYWLLENRHRDPAGNGQTVTMINSGTQSTKSFPKDTTGFYNSDVTSLSGVITDVEDLDWSLPGGTVRVDDKQILGVNGGILIWHIDEDIISANLASNTVNADPNRRGVDLEQAGGAQDIGETISSIFGDEIAAGSPLDYWFSGNIAPLYANRFGADTYPSSRANSGAYSHVTVRDFSQPGPLMFVVISIGDDIIAPSSGYPVDFGAGFVSDSLEFFVQTADIAGDAGHEIFVTGSPKQTNSNDTAFVFGISLERAPLLTQSYASRVIAEPGITRWLGAPLIGDITGDGVKEVAVYGKTAGGSRVSVYASADANSDGLYDPLYSFESGTQAHAVPSIIGGKLYVRMPYANGTDTMFVCGQSIQRIAIQRATGVRPGANTALGAFPGSENILSSTEQGASLFNTGTLTESQGNAALLPMLGLQTSAEGIFNCAVSDFDGDSVSEGAVLSATGIRLLSLESDANRLSQSALPGSLNLRHYPAQLSSMDIDGDLRNDIVIADLDRVLVFNYALSSTDYFPATFGAGYTLGVRFPGNKQDALFAIGGRQLSQVVTGAKQAEGFPVPLPADASVVLFPLGIGTQRLGISSIGSDGKLFVFETQNEVDANSFVWRSVYANEMNTNAARGKGSAGAPIETFFPAERCYNWPNPAYDAITKFRFYVSENAQVTIKIFDIAGDKVDQLQMSAAGGTDNEIDWNVSHVESGVYIAHIKAEAGGQSGEKIIKVAIVK